MATRSRPRAEKRQATSQKRRVVRVLDFGALGLDDVGVTPGDLGLDVVTLLCLPPPRPQSQGLQYLITNRM
jgi:hypothetical protein